MRQDGPVRWKTMTLHPHEFIRRFLTHALPKGFHRIRHYGLFASSNRTTNIARARELLSARPACLIGPTCWAKFAVLRRPSQSVDFASLANGAKQLSGRCQLSATQTLPAGSMAMSVNGCMPPPISRPVVRLGRPRDARLAPDIPSSPAKRSVPYREVSRSVLIHRVRTFLDSMLWVTIRISY